VRGVAEKEAFRVSSHIGHVRSTITRILIYWTIDEVIPDYFLFYGEGPGIVHQCAMVPIHNMLIWVGPAVKRILLSNSI
jgi:hypothetical protein